MNALTRWVPRLMIVAAVAHVAIALTDDAWPGILRDGFFRSVVDHGSADYDARHSAVWFLAGGLALFALGVLTQHVVRSTGRLPAQVGWLLLLLGVPLCLVSFPAIGAWALLVLGVLALVAARRPAPVPA